MIPDLEGYRATKLTVEGVSPFGEVFISRSRAEEVPTVIGTWHIVLEMNKDFRPAQYTLVGTGDIGSWYIFVELPNSFVSEGFNVIYSDIFTH